MPVSGHLWQVRKAVRPWLKDKNKSYLFGCSGGADSIALAIALLEEGKDSSIIPVVIDHGLQENSAQVTQQTLQMLKQIGYQKIESARANIEIIDGLEASARRARYKLFNEFIDSYNAKYFFLAHTKSDQAENVILGLLRGSGTRSLSGMSLENGKFIRPLLHLTRTETEAACAEAGVQPWLDPHNQDERFARVKIRKRVIPNLIENIGDKVIDSLSRSAYLMRMDADALDEQAEQYWNQYRSDFKNTERIELEVEQLLKLHRAVRARVLRLAIYEMGAPSGSLTADMIFGVEALCTDWHGQGVTSLPGNVKVLRNSGTIVLSKQH